MARLPPSAAYRGPCSRVQKARVLYMANVRQKGSANLNEKMQAATKDPLLDQGNTATAHNSAEATTANAIAQAAEETMKER